MDGPILPGAIFRTWPLSVEGYRDRPVTPVGPYGGRAPEGDR